MSDLLKFFKISKGNSTASQFKSAQIYQNETQEQLPNEKKAEKILTDFDMDFKYGPSSGI